MKTITVFTPTYNRAYCLSQVYKSLCNQTKNDFEWLVIDDGSTDGTKILIEKWILENKIDIKYCYKENGGMHSGHNKAYDLITTPYNVCIDSDDFMPNDAIEIILKEIKDLPEDFAGIIGLDAGLDQKVIGTEIPKHLSRCKLNELYSKYKVIGDKKLVYRTKIINQFPRYPEFKNEKLVPLDYIYLLIDQQYDLKPVNKILCIVEYQLDGSSLNIFKQYVRNPRGFAFSRISRIAYGITFKERFKNAIHLVSSAVFVKDFSLLQKTNRPFLVFLAIPFGLVLNLFIRYKTNN